MSAGNEIHQRETARITLARVYVERKRSSGQDLGLVLRADGGRDVGAIPYYLRQQEAADQQLDAYASLEAVTATL